MEPITSASLATTQTMSRDVVISSSQPSRDVVVQSTVTATDEKIERTVSEFLKELVLEVVDRSIEISEEISDNASWILKYVSMFPSSNDQAIVKKYTSPIFAKKIKKATEVVLKDKKLAEFATHFGIDLTKLDKKMVLPSLLMLMTSFDVLLPECFRETSVLLDPIGFLKCIRTMYEESYKINDVYVYKFSATIANGVSSLIIAQTLIQYEMWVISLKNGEIEENGEIEDLTGDQIAKENKQLFEFFKTCKVSSSKCSPTLLRRAGEKNKECNQLFLVNK